MDDALRQLKVARETMGVALKDVSDGLKICEPYLIALEEKDYSRLPELVYSVGFLRSYCNFLGIDSVAMIAQLKREWPRMEEFVIPIGNYGYKDDAVVDEAEGADWYGGLSLKKIIKSVTSSLKSVDSFKILYISYVIIAVSLIAMALELL
jgi:hypothetical protein